MAWSFRVKEKRCATCKYWQGDAVTKYDPRTGKAEGNINAPGYCPMQRAPRSSHQTCAKYIVDYRFEN